MATSLTRASRALVCLITAIATTTAFADKPSWAGGDKGDRQRQEDRRDGPGRDHQRDGGDRADRGDRGGHERHFDDRHRAAVHDYYAGQFKHGRCPPGLAKKHNGCMPPGQARKWEMGRPLPRDVVYYEVPQPVVVQLGPPPVGHKYVRVAGDILMIAVGTGMVVDAIQDIGR